jgi:hypothetical protein
MNKNKQAILEIAEQLLWWQPPEKAILNTKRLITQILEYSTPKSVRVLFDYFSHEEIIEALNNPIPGIMSEKSWRFWHIYLKLPLSPLPKRRIS